MKSYIGQIKWVFVESMNQNKDNRSHAVVIVGQEGSMLKGIALSTKWCKALGASQAPVWDGGHGKGGMVYPAFNRGYQMIEAKDFKGEKWEYEMDKADRKRLIVEMGRFEKKFGFDLEG